MAKNKAKNLLGDLEETPTTDAEQAVEAKVEKREKVVVYSLSKYNKGTFFWGAGGWRGNITEGEPIELPLSTIKALQAKKIREFDAKTKKSIERPAFSVKKVKAK